MVVHKRTIGKLTTKVTPKMLNSVVNIFEKNSVMSVRVSAKLLNLAKSILSYIKPKRLGTKARVKPTAPKYIKKQKNP